MPKRNLFKNKFITYTAVLVLVIFLHYVNVLRPVENFIYYIFLPAQRELYKIGTDMGEIWENANLNNKELVLQNQMLKDRIQQIIIDESEVLELKSENEELRKQLNFIEDKDYKYLISRVAGNNLAYNINSYILDKGSDDGVKEGQAVVAMDGVVVGKIRQVFHKESELLLLIDNQSALAAVVQNKDNSQGVVEGEYGLTMKMNLIPQDEEIDHGDFVITSGIEQYIPRGLLVGSIDKVETKVNELFQSAIVSSAVDYKKLNIVMVIVE